MKVLCIGQRFHRRSGGGITLSNLFDGFNKNNLFSLPLQPGESAYDVCENVYEIGQKDIQYFGLFLSSKKSNGLQAQTLSSVQSSVEIKTLPSLGKGRRNKRSLFTCLNGIVLSLTGLNHFKIKYVVSTELEAWLKHTQVDVIYAQFSTYAGMQFIIDICKLVHKPLVIHFMDDWINTVVKPSLTSHIVKKMYDRKFKEIVALSNQRIAISESMAAAYFQRYGFDFNWIHNPIDPSKWTRESTMLITGQKVIGYFGSIGFYSKDSLYDIALAIDSLNLSTLKLRLFTNDAQKMNKSFFKFQCVEIYPMLPFSEYKSALRDCSLLIIPFGFSTASMRFTKLSMPTKLSEYLMSGVPILVYAPHESALFQFCDKHSCATTLGVRDMNKLKHTIQKIIDNPVPYLEKAKFGQQMAISKLSKDAMQKKLLDIIESALLTPINA